MEPITLAPVGVGTVASIGVGLATWFWERRRPCTRVFGGLVYDTRESTSVWRHRGWVLFVDQARALFHVRRVADRAADAALARCWCETAGCPTATVMQYFVVEEA